MNTFRNRFWAVCLTALMWMPCTLSAGVVTVANPNGNGIYSALQDMGLNIREVDSLKVTGTLTEADFKIMNNVMNSLIWVDLTGTDIDEIPDEAFKDCNHLTEILLPPSLTVFGTSCFQNCSNLKSVVGGENVQVVGSWAFEETRIQNAPFGDKLISVGDGSFRNCSITGDIVFPECFKSFQNYSFHHSNIRSVDLSKCPVYINYACFSECYSLERVVFSENGSFEIEECGFFNDPLLLNISIPKSVSRIGQNAFSIHEDSEIHPRTVTLQNTTPPDAYDHSFSNSYNENYTLIVPAGKTFDYLISKGFSVFGNIIEAGYLVNIEGNGTVSVGAKEYADGSICFPVINTATEFNIVPAVGYEVVSASFNGNSVSLSGNKYTVGSDITTGSLNVVFAAKSLNVTVSNNSGGTISFNGSNIQNGAVLAANGGESLSFNIQPSDGYFVKSIRFNGTESVIYDGTNVFNTPVLTDNSTIAVVFGTPQEFADYVKVKVDKKGFGSILYKGNVIATGSRLIVSKNENTVFSFAPGTDGYVKSLLVNTFDMSSNVAGNSIDLGLLAQDVNIQITFFSNVDVQIDNPNGKLREILTEQGVNARKIKLLKLTGNVLSQDITTIKTMSVLNEVDLSETKLTEIPISAFMDMTNITNVSLPLTVTVINESAFENCRGLSYITGFDNVRLLERRSFNGCVKLSVLPYGNKIEAIREEVFEGCSSLPKDIVMYPSLKELGGFAFCYEGINKIDLSQCVFENTTLSWYAFSNFTSVLLPQRGSYSLHYLAFSNTAVKSLTIPSAVTSITYRVFEGANNLKDLYLQSTIPPKTDSDPFGIDCAMITLHVPTGSADLYANTAQWCDFGKIVEYGIGLDFDNNGSIFVNGVRQSIDAAIFPDGNDITFSLTPNPGYEVDKVLLDGTYLTAENGIYTIPANIEAGTLSVRWAIKRYGLTVNAQGNGKVYAGGRELTSGEVLYVDTAAVVQFELSPANGYMVKSISYNGQESVVQNGGRVFVTPAIQGASTMNVVFAEQSSASGVFQFNITTGSNGSIVYKNTTLLPETSVNISSGANAVFEINPNKYYRIERVLYNGADVTANVVDDKLTVSNVNQAATIDVSFCLDRNVSVALTLPGTLGAVLPEELKAVVDYLFVTGPMNEQDFDVIRNEMPNVRVVDLAYAEFTYVPDRAFYSETGNRIETVALPPTVDHISCEAFKGCPILYLIVNTANPFDICGDAFDWFTLKTGTVYVPVGTETAYRNYGGWDQFEYITDGVVNRNDDRFYLNGILYAVTDFENRQVQAILDVASEYESLPSSVQIDGLTFAVLSARLKNMDDEGYIMLVADGSTGPWDGKYWYSSQQNGETWVNAPADNWMDLDYDDSDWTPFAGPLARGGFTGYTQWKGEHDCYWIRRYVVIDEIPASLIRIHVDMDDEINLYVNGKNVYNGGSGEITISASCLKTGTNIFAAKGMNSGGGPAYMDFSVAQVGFNVDGLLYTITNVSDKEVTLSGVSQPVKDLYVPASISIFGISYKVTSIIESAFKSDTILTRVYGMENVKNIGNEAFYYCSSLNEFVFPDGLSSIGSSAFEGCSRLNQTIVIPSSVRMVENRAFMNSGVTNVTLNCYGIGYNAFEGCKYLERLTLNEGVTHIDGHAFAGCGIVGKLMLPSTLTYLGEAAFYECKKITELNVPTGVKIINNGAFQNCYSLTSVTFNEGLQAITSYAFYSTNLANVVLPSSLREIGAWAFCENHNLRSISINEGVNRIGEYAFYNCDTLESVTLPSSLSRINEHTFAECRNLKHAYLSESITLIGDRAFENCGLLEIILPQRLKTIETCAFNNCGKLKKVVFNDALSSIGESAFNCCAIDSIILHSNISSLKPYVFNGCGNVVYVELPDNLSSIEERAFNGCNSISEIIIPASVTALGENCLRGIPMVYMESATPPIMSSNEQFDEFTAIILPAGAYDAYINADYWNLFKLQFTTTDNLERIVYVTEDPNNSNLSQVLGENNLPFIVGLKVIGSINSYDIMVMRNKMNLLRYLDLSEATVVANDYEYYEGCHTEDYVIGTNSFLYLNLSTVKLPVNTIKIGAGAFRGCHYLQSVTIYDNVQFIENDAFSDCSQLKSVVIPDAVEYIGGSAFSSCGQLKSAYIGDGVKSIEGGAFAWCGALTDLRLGKNIQAIGSDAFRGCSNLKHVDFGKELQYLSYGAFAECRSLTDVTLPPKLIEISEEAFAWCSNLKEVKISSSVKYIRNWAFNGCPLEKVYTYTIEPTNINQNTFSAYKTASLYVPTTSYYNYYWHTQWSQFLELVEFDEPYDFFYLNGDYELDDNTGRISGVPSMEMNQTAGITVEGNDVQEISDIELNFDYSNDDVNDKNDAGPSIIAGSGDTSNGVANLTAKSMDVNIGVDGSRWYFFCFPYDLDVDSIECSAEYVFYKYDGQKRSRGLTGWTKLNADDKVLIKGNGYIFQASYTSMLTIHVAHEYLNFTGDIESQALNTYEGADLSDANWNFVGNPFISYYDIKDLASEYDAPIAVWNGSSYDVYKPGDDDYQLRPFEAFFVQKSNNKSSIEYLPENRITYSTSKTRMAMYASQRAAMGTPMAIDRQLVNIVIMNSDSVSDRTRIVYSTKATKDYEIGVDAAKFHTDGVPQIYTLSGTTKYAINERPMADDDIRIGFCAPTDGTYTLSIPRQDADVAIFDKETGKYVDFTFGDYSFVTKAGTFNDRFVIHRTGGVTAIENGFRLDGLTVTTTDGGIDIEGRLAGKIAIYTESGMLVAEPTQTGRLLLSDGVYIVKIGERSVKISVN